MLDFISTKVLFIKVYCVCDIGPNVNSKVFFVVVDFFY
jgi:hypothetical protein